MRGQDEEEAECWRLLDLAADANPAINDRLAETRKMADPVERKARALKLLEAIWSVV